MVTLKHICLLIAFAAVVKSDFQWGGCPSYSRRLESFEVSKYSGKWFEIAREQSTPYQKGECGTAEYSLNEDGSLKVVNSELLPSGEFNSIIGRITTTSDPFRLQVEFSDSFFGKLFKGDYQVVDTDYESFSVVYSCTSLFVGRIEYYWILSRTPHIESDKTIELLNVFSEKLNVSVDKFKFTNQEKDACRR